MDLGLGTLTEVKQHVLAAALRTGSTYDGKLKLMAKGVAGQCERYCNRKFARVVGDTFCSPGDRQMIVLPRYPIEEVTTLEQKFSQQQGWEALDTSLLVQVVNDKGMLQFYARPGTYLSQLRITYTGGFWFDTKEESDPTYPSVQPAGTALLPHDLKLAWLQQIARAWELHDKLGTGITKTGGDATFVAQTLGALDLIPDVKATLDDYRRFN